MAKERSPIEELKELVEKRLPELMVALVQNGNIPLMSKIQAGRYLGEGHNQLSQALKALEKKL